MTVDPIVEEIRKTARRIQEECGNDLHRFSQRITENEKKLKAEGWKSVSEPFRNKKVECV
jgi:hypothetical protein